MIRKIKNIIAQINKLGTISQQVNRIQEIQNNQSVLLGNIASRIDRLEGTHKTLNQHEFKVFSQWGDDGIIQYLINEIDIENKIFVEFGVENYRESNTRFLLTNNNWSGLIMDGSQENIQFIKNDPLYWRYNIKAEHAFITAENINQLIEGNGIAGEIGLLHIDIDGNDYWVWKNITCIKPVIVIVEYNAIFGKERPITIPYKPDFVRSTAHHSNLYFGASLKALGNISAEKGYTFIGCTNNGNNAYFVRNDKLGAIPKANPETGFISSKFRESRDVNGNLSYLSGGERISAIQGLEVINIETGKTEKI